MTTLTSATGIIVTALVALLLVESRSVIPAGAVTVAVLTIEPVADPTTVPVTLNVMLAPAGTTGSTAPTLFPLTVTALGQTAPPVADRQLAATLVKVLGTLSLNVAPFAALGPALLTTIV